MESKKTGGQKEPRFGFPFEKGNQVVWPHGHVVIGVGPWEPDAGHTGGSI